MPDRASRLPRGVVQRKGTPNCPQHSNTSTQRPNTNTPSADSASPPRPPGPHQRASSVPPGAPLSGTMPNSVAGARMHLLPLTHLLPAQRPRPRPLFRRRHNGRVSIPNWHCQRTYPFLPIAVCTPANMPPSCPTSGTSPDCAHAAHTQPEPNVGQAQDCRQARSCLHDHGRHAHRGGFCRL